MSNVHEPGKPWLMLDVDGVLNIMGKPKKGHRDVICNGYHIRYSSETQPRLARLKAHFDLVWATTWGHDANFYISPLFGLGELPVCSFTILRENFGAAIFGTWKLRDILAYVDGRPFAWIDDMIYADGFKRAPANALLVPVDERVGLNQTIEDTLVAWAKARA